ncbi:hypothetical protein LC653_41505 [Nostoc sp. CHAB 5784]|uniref:hypothetical protein n=1 Tax=Nostoc mirabile TaxID=2907820 RepID=UPI001E607550|nr:hypothetical protein [Nostoc mirabile]MCC5670102.1 hypothetical protein [Nostoc mirabile CHAB5784]
MSDSTPDILKVNQQAGLDAVSAIEHLSDQELGELVLKALINMGCPASNLNDLSLLGMDTSREGLLDFIAGNAAIAHATPVDMDCQKLSVIKGHQTLW